MAAISRCVRRTGATAAGLALALSLGGCGCGSGAFDRLVRFSAAAPAVSGPPQHPLKVFAVMAGETVRVSAAAVEVYRGDSGCEARGVLGPDSGEEPARFRWTSSSPSVVRVDSLGALTALAPGEAVITAVAERFDVQGSFRMRVVPAFVSVQVEPDSATVEVGDTVGFLLTALDARGEHVSGVNFRTAALRLEPTIPGGGQPAGNSIFSDLDGDPPRLVYIGIERGGMRLVARTRVLGATELTDTLLLIVEGPAP